MAYLTALLAIHTRRSACPDNEMTQPSLSSRPSSFGPACRPFLTLVLDHRLNDHHHRRFRHAANPAK
jgi:hypothetical protein